MKKELFSQMKKRVMLCALCLGLAGMPVAANAGPIVLGAGEGKALNEGRAGSIAFLNQGADLIAGPGLTHAWDINKKEGLVTFGALQGGWSEYNTGSHVSVGGGSLLAGLGWRLPVVEHSLLLGAFFEAGWSEYDSSNNFDFVGRIKGHGGVDYYGGGLLARFESQRYGPGNFHAEASVRAGGALSDFHSNNLTNAVGSSSDYDLTNAYVGAHAGIGYFWQINEKPSLDIYTKYFWTHQMSDNDNVLGYDIHFNSTDSHRWRTGARFAYAFNDYVVPFLGAAFEYEFSGKSHSNVDGFSTNEASLRGSTGMGELGLTVKPMTDKIPFYLDFGVQGFLGQRDGVMGTAQIRYTF